MSTFTHFHEEGTLAKACIYFWRADVLFNTTFQILFVQDNFLQVLLQCPTLNGFNLFINNQFRR